MIPLDPIHTAVVQCLPERLLFLIGPRTLLWSRRSGSEPSTQILGLTNHEPLSAQLDRSLGSQVESRRSEEQSLCLQSTLGVQVPWEGRGRAKADYIWKSIAEALKGAVGLYTYLAGAKRKKQALPLRAIQHRLAQAFPRSPVRLG